MINPTISTIQQIQQGGVPPAQPAKNDLISQLLAMPQPRAVSPQSKPAQMIQQQVFSDVAAPQQDTDSEQQDDDLKKQLKELGVTVFNQDTSQLKKLQEQKPELFNNSQLWASINQQPLTDVTDQSQVGLKEYANLKSSKDMVEEASKISGVPLEVVQASAKTQQNGGGAYDSTDPSLLQRFNKTVNEIWQSSKIKNNSPEAAGTKAFLFGMLSGLPFDQVAQMQSQAYRETAAADAAYRRALDVQKQRDAAAMELERLKSRNTQAAKLSEGTDVANLITNKLIQSNVPPPLIQQIYTPIQRASAMAKDNPAAATSVFRDLFSQLTTAQQDATGQQTQRPVLTIDRALEVLGNAPITIPDSEQAGDVMKLAQLGGANNRAITAWKLTNGFSTDQGMSPEMKKYRDQWEKAIMRGQRKIADQEGLKETARAEAQWGESLGGRAVTTPAAQATPGAAAQATPGAAAQATPGAVAQATPQATPQAPAFGAQSASNLPIITTSSPKELEANSTILKEVRPKVADNAVAAKKALPAVEELQALIKQSPQVWGVLAKSPAWEAYVNAKPEDRARAWENVIVKAKVTGDDRVILNRANNVIAKLQALAATTYKTPGAVSNLEAEKMWQIVGTMTQDPRSAWATLEDLKGGLARDVDYANKFGALYNQYKSRLDPTAFQTWYAENYGDAITEQARKRAGSALPKPKAPAAQPSAPANTGEWKIIR